MPTYYALFTKTLAAGPPPAGPFEIDRRALRAEFLGLQAESHPDLQDKTGDANSGGNAAERSALINGAYSTLASPLARAEYLLRELHGVDLAGDERGAETPADATVLMTVLEAREAMEEARTEDDLLPLKAANEARIAEAEAALGEAFAAGNIDEAKALTVRLRYWVNIRDSIRDWSQGKPVVLQH